MNLEAGKIEFVMEFLKLQSEESVSRLEHILRKEKNRARFFTAVARRIGQAYRSI